MSLYNSPNLRTTKRTQASKIELAYAIKQGIINHGFEPNESAIACLLTQIGCETSFTKYCYNYNVGNIKQNPDKAPFMFLKRVSEIINGKQIYFNPPHRQCCFKSFDSLEEGISYWLRLLLKSNRYVNVRKTLFNQNESYIEFARELKKSGYFTASLSHYTNVLGKLYNNCLVHSANAMRMSTLESAIDELELKESIYMPISDILKEIEEGFQIEEQNDDFYITGSD